MSQTKETEFATAKVPTPVWLARPVPIDQAGSVSDIVSKIESGRAFLKVVAYPWGVEFDVRDGGDEG
jgi:hypothetical protein